MIKNLLSVSSRAGDFPGVQAMHSFPPIEAPKWKASHKQLQNQRCKMIRLLFSFHIYSFCPLLPTSTTWSMPSYSGSDKSYFSLISGLTNLTKFNPKHYSFRRYRVHSPATNEMSSLEVFYQRFRRRQTHQDFRVKVSPRTFFGWTLFNVPG